jgi:hypothetical protein
MVYQIGAVHLVKDLHIALLEGVGNATDNAHVLLC